MEILKGKKTYIIAAIGAALAFVQLMGWWDVPEAVWGFIGAGGIMALRQGVKNSG